MQQAITALGPFAHHADASRRGISICGAIIGQILSVTRLHRPYHLSRRGGAKHCVDGVRRLGFACLLSKRIFPASSRGRAISLHAAF